MLEWKPDYETGVLTVDAQHKVLFGHINRLGKLLENPEIRRSEADFLLNFLEGYASLHFRSEETCMARYKCPAYAKNKEDHAVFLNILKFCKAEYEATDQPRDMLLRLHETMVWWITHHILRVDVQLKESTGSKQVAE